MWPAFNAVVSAQELDNLGKKLEIAKKAAPTRPHPHTSANSTVQKTVGSAAALTDHLRDSVTGRAADVSPDPQVP